MELEDLIDDTEYEDGLPDIWCGTLCWRINKILQHPWRV